MRQRGLRAKKLHIVCNKAIYLSKSNLTASKSICIVISSYTVFPWFSTPGRLPIFGGALIKTYENLDLPFSAHTRTLFIAKREEHNELFPRRKTNFMTSYL